MFYNVFFLTLYRLLAAPPPLSATRQSQYKLEAIKQNVVCSITNFIQLLYKPPLLQQVESLLQLLLHPLPLQTLAVAAYERSPFTSDVNIFPVCHINVYVEYKFRIKICLDHYRYVPHCNHHVFPKQGKYQCNLIVSFVLPRALLLVIMMMDQLQLQSISYLQQLHNNYTF